MLLSENNFDQALRSGGQTYKEYVSSMSTHGLEPMGYTLWAAWELYWAEDYDPSKITVRPTRTKEKKLAAVA